MFGDVIDKAILIPSFAAKMRRLRAPDAAQRAALA
jgi:hypothetical protein